MDQLLLSDYGIQRINEIRQVQKKKENCYGISSVNSLSLAGCTALVCLITSQEIYIANAGDSKCIASVKRTCQKLTRQHRPQIQSEFQRIKKANGFIKNGRILGNLNVSRAIGNFHYKDHPQLSYQNQMVTCQPQISVLKKRNVDYIYMGCDGVWETKSQQQIHEWLLRQCFETNQASQKLQNLLSDMVSKDKNSVVGKDNMTAILIKFQ